MSPVLDPKNLTDAGAIAPTAQKGWHALQRAVATTLPTNLRRSKRIRSSALRNLRRASR